MKKVLFFFVAAFVTISFTNSVNAQATASYTAAQQSSVATRPMAAEGQKVWVIVNHIKADKRRQFEQFIHEVFWPGAAKLSPEDQRVFRQTRVLHPTKAEADGTWSYLFIMDPLIEGADYGIETLLKKMYGEEKGTEYGKILEEAFARDQTPYLVIQSKD